MKSREDDLAEFPTIICTVASSLILMFLLNMLLAIVGMILLIGLLVFFAYKLLRSEKGLYTWLILIVIVFFLGLALWQSVLFLVSGQNNQNYFVNDAV